MGKIICAGLGPGDPDLISVRADRAIRGARQIAYFRKKGRAGQARRIVAHMLAEGVIEHAMEYPVTTEIPFDSPEYNRLLAAFYDEWTARLAALAAQDENAELKAKFAPLAKTLADNEATILAELNGAQGKALDIGGYYHPDIAKTAAAMRPSKTLNDALATLSA